MNKHSEIFENIFPNQINAMNQNTPEQQVALNKSLIKALAETKDIVADSTNPFHKNKYASLSQHLTTLKPIFAKNGLGILQLPIGDMESVGVRTIIIHADGGSVRADALVPAEKGISGQNAGSLYSYLRRYALASVAGVATEDDDAETNRVDAPSPAKSYVNLNAKGTKFIPNPNAEKSVQGKGSSDVVAPFGDAKGTPLSALPLRSTDRSKKCADLNYWANAWQPKPFGDSGVISKRDLATKAEAQRLWADANGAPAEDAPVADAEVQDEIPF
ncbi:Essential recombination function protein [uncultured Caudovirales phage]|uniref:Essential recombination function protein n=1 Tax=uncultured Caudovirales phage TaxID=2100421 RepID=A0A6J7WGE9_9CAUD|nr:Essential recombination function protein [uncultured Caudovirales phage]